MSLASDKIIKILQCICKQQSTIIGNTEPTEPVHQIDVEKSSWICKDDTWQYEVCVFIDGVKQEPVEMVDSGISCEEEPPVVPIDIEISHQDRCDPDTETIWRQYVAYQAEVIGDPQSPINTTLLGDEQDTGIPCGKPKQKGDCYTVPNWNPWVDNHEIADRPPGRPVAPGRDYIIKKEWSDGRSTADPLAAQPGWGEVNDELAAVIALDEPTQGWIGPSGDTSDNNPQAADGDPNTPYGAYAHALSVCPGSPVLTKVTACQLNAEGEVVATFSLAFGVNVTETQVWFCKSCGEAGEWQDDDGNTIEKPECVFRCGEVPEVPEAATPDCVPLGSPIQACEIKPEEEDGEGNITSPAAIIQSDIFLSFTNCGGTISLFAYTLDADGNADEHTLSNSAHYYGDCDSLVEIKPPDPDCIEGDRKCVEIETSFVIVDNSNFQNAPAVHLPNGINPEYTFKRLSGATNVIRPSSDNPYYNALINEGPSVLTDCIFKAVCANHPKGCNPVQAANLAEYGVTPDISELFASGWLIECGCDDPIVCVTITDADDPAWIGAYRNTIVRKRKKQYTRVETCIGVGWFDTKGQPIAEPAGSCCWKPCDPDSADTKTCTTCKDNKIFQTYATTPYTIDSVTIGGVDQSVHFTGLPVNGTSFLELTMFRDELLECLTKLGIDYEIRYGRDGWLITWDGPKVVLGQSNGDLISSNDCIEQTYRLFGLNECDKAFFADLINGCDNPCPPVTTHGAVCNDEDQVVNDVTITAGSPIIRKTIDYFKEENCTCVPDETKVRFFDFENPSFEFTDPVAFTGECDFETSTQERCDRNGNPITVTVISVNVSDGVSVQTSYGDVNGNPIPEPLLPLGICNPQVQVVKGCVINKDGTKTHGILHLQYDQAGNPGYDVSVFVPDGSQTGKVLGTSAFSCNCAPSKECAIPKQKFCYSFPEFAGCSSPTIVINGVTTDLCPDGSGNGVVPTSGDICLTGGVRSYAGVLADGRCGRPTGATDALNAATQLLNGGTYTPGGTSQYNNTSIAVNGSFALSGNGGVLTFAGTNYSSASAGISFYVRDCVSGDTLPAVTSPAANIDSACNAIIPNSTNGNFPGTAGPFSIQWDATGYLLENLVIETIVQGPTDTFGGITLQNGNGPVVPYGPQTCNATTLTELAQLLNAGTDDAWVVEGDSVCTTSEETYGPIGCGDPAALTDPTITDATTAEEIPTMGLSDCDLRTLTATTAVAWRDACLTVGGESAVGMIQYDVLTGLNTGLATVKGQPVTEWTEGDPCDCCCSGDPVEPACTAEWCVRGFDYFGHEDWEAGDGPSWEVFVDGNSVGTATDDPGALPATNTKSTWYAGLMALVNSSGWSMVVETDVAGSDNSQKPVFKFTGPCGSDIRIVRNGSGDTLSLKSDDDGNKGQGFTNGGDSIESETFVECP